MHQVPSRPHITFGIKCAKIELGHHSHQPDLSTSTASPIRCSHFAPVSFYSAISLIIRINLIQSIWFYLYRNVLHQLPGCGLPLFPPVVGGRNWKSICTTSPRIARYWLGQSQQSIQYRRPSSPHDHTWRSNRRVGDGARKCGSSRNRIVGTRPSIDETFDWIRRNGWENQHSYDHRLDIVEDDLIGDYSQAFRIRVHHSEEIEGTFAAGFRSLYLFRRERRPSGGRHIHLRRLAFSCDNPFQQPKQISTFTKEWSLVMRLRPNNFVHNGMLSIECNNKMFYNI